MTARELIKKILDQEDFNLDDKIEISLLDTRDHEYDSAIVNFDIAAAEDNTIFIHAQSGRINGSNENTIIQLPEENYGH
jgi:hypothetical protein